MYLVTFNIIKLCITNKMHLLGVQVGFVGSLLSKVMLSQLLHVTTSTISLTPSSFNEGIYIISHSGKAEDVAATSDSHRGRCENFRALAFHDQTTKTVFIWKNSYTPMKSHAFGLWKCFHHTPLINFFHKILRVLTSECVRHFT